MEDIRLFSIPPSHQLSGDVDVGLDNSSDTERPRGGSYGELAALASVDEEAPSPGILEQYITTHDQADKAQFLGDWFGDAGAATMNSVSSVSSVPMMMFVPPVSPVPSMASAASALRIGRIMFNNIRRLIDRSYSKIILYHS